jgi:diacylglycerol kinase family enzyme
VNCLAINVLPTHDETAAIPTVGLILNPAAGQGTLQAHVRQVAHARQIDVHEVCAGRGPDVLARDAVDGGAQILAAAGGDGTMSAVAAVAVDFDVPLIVVPCGTRNHFAKDCGANLIDPARQLAAIADGHEVRVDVGTVNGRVFLDNVSVGFYAAMVRDPEYRHRRVRVAARYVRRAMFQRGRCASLSTAIPARVLAPEQVLVALVSNNAYSPGIAPGPALRPRLDEGTLWVYLVGLPGADRPFAARLLRGTGRLVSGRALVAAWPTVHQTMTTDTRSIPAGIDGEAVELESPLAFDVRPGALRLLQPSRNDLVDRRLTLRW